MATSGYAGLISLTLGQVWNSVNAYWVAAAKAHCVWMIAHQMAQGVADTARSGALLPTIDVLKRFVANGRALSLTPAASCAYSCCSARATQLQMSLLQGCSLRQACRR